MNPLGPAIQDNFLIHTDSLLKYLLHLGLAFAPSHYTPTPPPLRYFSSLLVALSLSYERLEQATLIYHRSISYFIALDTLDIRFRFRSLVCEHNRTEQKNFIIYRALGFTCVKLQKWTFYSVTASVIFKNYSIISRCFLDFRESTRRVAPSWL